MSDVIKRQKEQDKFPVQDAHENEETEEGGNFENAPVSVRAALSFDFSKDCFGIIAQIAEKDVAPDVLCLPIVAMAVNRQPIDRLSFFVWAVAVAHVMPMMDILVEGLRESKRHRFEHGEYSIQRTPTEIRVVDEVMRDPVDVPGDANRVDDSQARQYPPWRHRKEREQGQHESKM